MSASSIQVYTLLFADPTWDLNTLPASAYLERSVSYSSSVTAIVTLSDTGLMPGTNLTGLIYTPDLSPDDSCLSAASAYVPSNVTRQTNLPNRDLNLVALAPWISPTCTLSFMQSAQEDLVSAFVFFVPTANNTQSPPSADNSQWSLGDNGNWKKNYKFPVFAIPGASGAMIMRESSQYSGNLTTVPYGALLAQRYDPRDYVRLAAAITISANSSLPSLWVFLLIVLGILLGVIFATSISMHCLQRTRRRRLRRRIVNGEIDLEALGIQRLTVPQHILRAMLLFEYGSGKKLSMAEATSRNARGCDSGTTVVDVQTTEANPKYEVSSSSSSTSVAHSLSDQPDFGNYMSQPTCCICLDDFIASGPRVPGSAVRQLPCGHIFHPECVDNFLQDNSSLCPMCKHSALPTGYCPHIITNRMVRRERVLRRMRARAGTGDDQNAQLTQSRGRLPGIDRVRQLLSFRRERAEPSSGHVMAEIPSTNQAPTTLDGSQHGTDEAALPARPSPTSANRREWARQRALAMLGRQVTVVEVEPEQRSRWRKIFRGVFPG